MRPPRERAEEYLRAIIEPLCEHGTRLDLQDCMQCADEAELADRLPTSTLTARLRAGMKP
jgi:hypothetical protein